ncbi:PREDICTED: homeobox-leucine zipper protein HOX11-like [Nelumbo nucifera]|uniref:Homeobox-leucine zipper protein HOX11-like n=1 Tax=Nelumbo nucifera TaxID=4432 RepID=A0A1U7ZV75_NELNU|nr:PREDICTED: homeobox-leucine zipper protein HOX11-like [Nelumbo nucifera]
MQMKWRRRKRILPIRLFSLIFSLLVPSLVTCLLLSPTENGNSEAGSSGHLGAMARGFDINWLPAAEDVNDGAAVSSPNGTVSSGNEVEVERESSRASDKENGLTRKKLRLSKEQSAFLEETFKEHNILNPVSRNPERESGGTRW